jgi:electron transport complex protein RnfG
MKKIKSTLPNIVISLTCICLAAGVALSATNNFTKHVIAAIVEAEFQNAIRKVSPDYDNNPVEERFDYAYMNNDPVAIYPAKMGGEFVGGAISSHTKNGFSGLIRVMAGFDADGKLLNYTVLEHNETPGLGTKMDAWFRADKSRQNIIGRDMKKGALKLIKDGGDLDAITAATISSRAFLEAINLAYDAFTNNPHVGSGATKE